MSLLATLALVALPAPQIDFPSLARESLAQLGYEGAEQDRLDLETFLEGRSFLRCELGGIELRIPVGLAEDKKRVKDIATCARDLVEMHRVWLRWTAPGEELDELDKDFDTVSKWVKSWTSRHLSRVDAEEGLDLAEAMDAPSKVREALARMKAAFVDGDINGIAPVGEERARIVLAASRESFLRTAAIAGLISPEHRRQLWDASAPTQMGFWVGPSQVVVMEYAALPVDPNAPFAGFPMEDGAKTRQRQHVLDRATATFLRRFLYRHEFHFFETALATNIVLEVIGENDLGTLGQAKDYTRPGSSTPPYERFVPGGNPGGGTLPPRSGGGGGGGGSTGSAKDIARWFRERGDGYYVKPLRESQKEGAKVAARADSGVDADLRRYKEAHFEINSRESSREAVISAPFFGPEAEAKALPEAEFLDDYEDFFASYRSCFFHWIRTEAGGDEAEEKFAELLRRYVVDGRKADVNSIVAEIYGLPVSAGTPEEPNLEWRFLDWLADQR